MAEQKESSLLFSLKDLTDVEADRVQRDRARQLELAAAERRAREAQMSAMKQREIERQRIDEARRADAERYEREEVARLDALQRSYVELARAEAGARARLDLVEQREQHERRLAQRGAGQLKRERLVLFASNLAWASVSVLAAVVYLGKLAPDAERTAQAYAGLIQAERERADNAERAARDGAQRIQALELELERRANERPVRPLPEPAKSTPARRRTPGLPPAPVKQPLTPAKCDPHDPLDPCI